MLTLPPPKIGARMERRSGDRRIGDRRAATSAKTASESAADAASELEAVRPVEEPQAEKPSAPKRAPRRRGGRRKSDAASETDPDPQIFARAPRPHAPLVAQIIATVLGVEQTRVKRRGTLAQAEALYAKERPRPQRSRGEA